MIEIPQPKAMPGQKVWAYNYRRASGNDPLAPWESAVVNHCEYYVSKHNQRWHYDVTLEATIGDRQSSSDSR